MHVGAFVSVLVTAFWWSRRHPATSPPTSPHTTVGTWVRLFGKGPQLENGCLCVSLQCSGRISVVLFPIVLWVLLLLALTPVGWCCFHQRTFLQGSKVEEARWRHERKEGKEQDYEEMDEGEKEEKRADRRRR